MRDADAIASRAEACIRMRDLEGGCRAIDPLALGRTKFPILDRIGARLGHSSLDIADLLAAFDRMISRESIGYYVIVGSGLQQRLRGNMATCLRNAGEYIKLGGTWDRCDTIAERVWGAALVADFPEAHRFLEQAVKNEDRWIRRAVGVAVHFFAKRRRDAADEMQQLLDLLGPVLTERNRDAAKGIGWGLKTIGRYQPKLLVTYLTAQIRHAHPTKLMIRKAITYLPASVKRRFILGYAR